MTSALRLFVVLGALGARSCGYTAEHGPRVTPGGETLWILVELQLKLDALRPGLAAVTGKSFDPERVDRLTGEVLQTTEFLSTGRGDADAYRAARYRADLIGVGYDLLRVDAECTARGIAGAVRATTNAG